MKLSRVLCLVTVACLLIFSQTTLAAECAPFCWTGPYAGVHLGYGTGNDDNMTHAWLPVSEQSLFPLTIANPDPHGFVGGAQAGYNWQCGCFVYGLEADFSWSGMSGTQTVVPAYDAFEDGSRTAKESINWYGTVRPRIGWACRPNVLIYGTGGLAYGNVSYLGNATFLPFSTQQYPASLSTTKIGWAVGGGVEYALCKCWTVKAEYLYMDLGSESAIANPISVNGFQASYTWQTTANIFQIGMNYKF